jgi:hypothetical protein
VYELARVRLFSIGPKLARYQNVTLDLRNVGAPVPRPAREALFDMTADASNVLTPRRPSPATVFFLENGGGKSVLIKLIFSVMLPGRRQVVGARGTRALDAFVLAQDVAHVALEWQHVQTGQRVVVGKVSAWRDHVASTDPNRLLEAWYSFRPTAEFSLDTLPFSQGGRIVSMAGFRERLNEAAKVAPHLQKHWETNHTEWRTHLTNLGLDPALFDYQRKMNAGEGEAADAFAFKSDEAFVDWLLTAVSDEDDLRSLGDVVDRYAAALSQRGHMIAERDFVEGALERLTPLSTATTEMQSAKTLKDQALQAAEGFAAAIAVRLRQEEKRRDELIDQEQSMEKRKRDADRQAGRLNRILNEMRRSLAKLRLDAAEGELQSLVRRRGEAGDALTAWGAAETIIAFNAATQEAEQIRRVVEREESKAAPLLAERDAAAKRLARGLFALITAADAKVAELDEIAARYDDQAGEQDAARTDAIRQSESERSRAAAAQSKIDDTMAQVRAAVDDGLLADADADVCTAAKQANDRASQVAGQVAAALRKLTDMTERRKRLQADVRTAEHERSDKQREAESAARAFEHVERTARALQAEERLAELIGTEQIQPETDAPVLIDALDASIRTAEEEQTALKIETAGDQRVLDALGADGLLPPAPHVTDGLAVLEAEKITAWSGWRYLSMLPPHVREQVLGTHPHLVDGIVLNNPDNLGKAEQKLAEARLLPRGVVAVGTTRAINDLDLPGPAGVGFIVPPNPAMYDEDQAEEERRSITERQRKRAGRLSTLDERTREDQRLLARLHAWQNDHPPGTWERLRTAKATTEAELTAVTGRLDGLYTRINELEQAEDALQESLPGQRDDEAEAKKVADRLSSLANTVSSLPGLRETVRQAREAASFHDNAEKEHREAAERLRKAAMDVRRERDDHRRNAHANRDELSRIPGLGTVDESVPVPVEPVQTLRDAYESARAAYEQAEIGYDLREKLRGLEERERQAGAELAKIEPRIRTLAENLLATPDGTDAVSRATATERASRTVQALDAQHTEQAKRVGQLQTEYDGLLPQEVTLESPYERPTSIEQAEVLVARAKKEWESARDTFDELHENHERLTGKVNDAAKLVEKLEAYRFKLGDLAPDEIDPDVPPFRGTMDDAAARLNQLLRRTHETNEMFDKAERNVRKAADALASYATDDEFAQVDSPIRRQILSVDRDGLPDYAHEWEAALRPRLRSLNDDLEKLDKHRSAIVDRLQGMVDQALATLRTSRRLSKLPDGLGDWSGQEFLRIRFETADPKVLSEALGSVIDEATSAGSSRSRDRNSGRRDGLTLLLRGVRAAMPKGIKVDVLKPDAVLRTERVRVAEISDVFSGGQLLTAAIVIYCTMAALRANERGQTRRPHAGVLFLDNPIGRASAGYLLELQLAVAEALGVQLVYTTGLFDTNALSVFPLIVRLRNDADLRAGLKYLTVDEAIRRPLADLGEPDGTGEITATRAYIRPTSTGDRPR